MTPTAEAVRRFRDLLGEAGVSTAPAELVAAETATYPTSTRVPVILRPASTSEVAACVTLAAELKLALYPVSGGRNYGYGSRAPTADAALLDLGRLQRVFDYDDRLGVVTVEAGVTFEGLFDFLRAQNAPWLAPATSGPPLGSVIGNALERGIGTGPHADRAGHLAALEVVLGDGTVLNTGADGRVAGLARDGAGPSLDGLFFQSNLGVVTRATVWLSPLPAHLTVTFLQVDEAARLHALVEALRGALHSGLTRPPVSVFNALRLLSVVRGYPWQEAQGRVPLPNDVLRSQCRDLRIPVFAADLALQGASAAHARVVLDHLLPKLTPQVDRWESIEADGPQLEALLRSPQGEHAFIDSPLRRALLLRHLGVPQVAPLSQTYWRKPVRPAQPGDPDRDGCGALWCCPLVPFTGEDAARAVALCEETLTDAGFEPGISLQGLSSRALHLICSLLWDRHMPGEDERALAAGALLEKRLHAAGYPAYRKSTVRMGAHRTPEAEVLRRIKGTLDPAHVLAPGRYVL